MNIRNKIAGIPLAFLCLAAVIIAINSVTYTKCYAETSYTGALISESGVSDTASALSEYNNIINVNAAAPDLFTGTMSYKIPITVPSGRGGMQPDLSLTYRSSNGNGWLGMGWTLEVDSIERNTRSGVNYNAASNADNFAVMRKSGSVSELINIGDADYRAKLEGSFNRIVRLTDSDGKPYWEAIDKKGTQYFFGRTAASRQDNPADSSQIFKWCLDQVIDTNGNAMTLSYSKNQGEIYLSQISYNGNVINFYLDGTRRDVNETYTTNFSVKTAYRLKSIDIVANGNRVRTYKLTYKDYRGNDSSRLDATGRSLLTSVVLYDKNAAVDSSGNITNASGINSITLFNAQDYSDTDGNLFNTTTDLGDINGASWFDFDFQGNPAGLNRVTATHITGDFNGDGKTDVLKLEPSIYNGFGWQGGSNALFFSNGDGRFSVITPSSDETGFDISKDWLGKGSVVLAGDFNADGKTDLLLWKPDGSNRILISNGDGSFTSRQNPLGTVTWTAASTRILVGDFDGDGMSDVLKWDSSGTINLYLARNNYSQATAGVSVTWTPGNFNFILGDFTGSGRTGILKVDNGGNNILLLADGIGNFTQVAAPVGIGTTGNWTPERAKVITGDFNGDGKTDILKIDILCPSGNCSPIPQTSTSTLFLSKGDGTFAPKDTTPLNAAGFYESRQNVYIQGMQGGPIGTTNISGDFNGDGKTDVLELYYGQNAPEILFLSNGDGTFTTKQLTDISFNAYKSAILPGDFLGNGKTGFLKWSETGTGNSLYLWGKEQPLDTLMSFQNALGGSTAIAYTSSTKYTNLQLPFPVKTVSSVTTNDGNGNVSSTAYSYKDGYYNIGDRDFRGFNYVKATGPSVPASEQKVTETWFHQGNDTDVIAESSTADNLKTLASTATGYLKGRPYRTRISDIGGAIYAETETGYAADKTNDAPWFNPPSQVDSYLCDGKATVSCKSSGIARNSRTAYKYDDYAGAISGEFGNLTHEYRYGDVTDHSFDFTVIRTYSPNTVPWIVGLPASEATYRGIVTGALPSPAAKTDFYYDDLASCDSTPSNNQTPVKGNLTRAVRWLKTPTPYTPASPETRIGYDANGNVVCTKDGKGNKSTIAYDNETHTFPVTVTNAKQQATTTRYYGVNNVPADKGLYGQAKSITDPNGAVTGASTIMEYDSLGRKTLESPPDGFWTRWSYNSLGYVNLQNVKQDRADNLSSASYFDGFGRTILVNKTWPNSGTYGIVTKTYYDQRGQVAQASLPFRSGVDTEKVTVFTHDPLGRVTNVTMPDQSHTKTCYSDLATAIIDENNHLKRQTRDPLGRLAKVEEYQGTYGSCPSNLGTPYATTLYGYDISGNLTTVIDTKQNRTDIAYDTLRRKVNMRDPDMGFWQYDYDPNANLALQTDAYTPPRKIKFGYDALNRLTTKDYGADNVIDVTYTYDTGPSAANPIGRLTSMIDDSGTTAYSYDSAGRTSGTVKSVMGDATYEIGYNYLLGRLDTITYPDKEKVVYGYGDDGNLSTVTGKTYDGSGNLLQTTVHATYGGYNALGQPGNVTFGNGVRTDYTYYPSNYRLNTIVTGRPSWGELLNLSYGYDDKGNVNSIIDSRDADLSANFAEDSYTFPNPLSAHPHAPDSSGTGRIFQYDTNGNMTSDGWNGIAYDFNNMPQYINGNLTLVYDGNGAKVKKINSASPLTYVYIDKLYECRNGNCGKYYFAGDSRIAVKWAGQTFYYHPDHLGSTRVVTSATGKMEEIVYLPFGVSFNVFGNPWADHRYTGQELVNDTGLYDYNARLYAPEYGRFVSPDSIIPDPANPQSLNRYAYVFNNPISYNDPTGHDPLVTIDTSGNITIGSSPSTYIPTLNLSLGELGNSNFNLSSYNYSARFDYNLLQGNTNLAGIEGVDTTHWNTETLLETSPLLETVQYTSKVNDYLSAASLGLLLWSPPLGAVALGTTGVIGLGLGITESYLTSNPSKAKLSLAEFFVGMGSGKLATKLGGLAGINYNFGANRFFSDSTGRFVTTVTGRNSYQLNQGVGAITSIPFKLYPNDK